MRRRSLTNKVTWVPRGSSLDAFNFALEFMSQITFASMSQIKFASANVTGFRGDTAAFLAVCTSISDPFGFPTRSK